MDTAIGYRLARLRDVDNLAAMSRLYVEAGLDHWVWRPRRLRALLTSAETCGVIAHASDEDLAGFAVMQFLDEHAHLALLAVKPAYRRQGIGRGLMQWLEESARTAGTLQVLLEVRQTNTGARAFYRQLGYEPVRVLPGYYSGVETALRLQRNLAVGTS